MGRKLDLCMMCSQHKTRENGRKQIRSDVPIGKARQDVLPSLVCNRSQPFAIIAILTSIFWTSRSLTIFPLDQCGNA